MPPLTEMRASDALAPKTATAAVVLIMPAALPTQVVEHLHPVSALSTPLIRSSGALHTFDTNGKTIKECSEDAAQLNLVTCSNDCAELVAAVTKSTPPACTKDLM